MHKILTQYESQYLVENNYVARDKASILGWSAGGELVIRSIASARPGTYKAAISNKGPHDTLRVSTDRPSPSRV